MKYFIKHIARFIDNPKRFFDNLLESRYWKIHKIFLLFPYLISLIFNKIKINKLLKHNKNKKNNNFYIKEIKDFFYNIIFLMLKINCYYERYYGSFYKYSISREKVLRFKKFKNKKKCYLYKKYIFELNSYSKINSLKQIWDDLLNKKEFNTSSNHIKNIFEKKKVLIIGPSEYDESIDLEKFDLICFPKISDNKFLIQKIKKNKIIIFSNNSYYLKNKNKLIDLKNSINNILIKPPLKGEFINFLTCDHLLNNDYGAMGIQNMIFSIILGKAENIFITGVNAYVGKVIYRKDYKNYDNNLSQFNNDLRRHEPLSNFCFIKNIYQLNLIDGDDEFKEVFRLSPKSYCRKLDEIYLGFKYRTNK